MHEGRKATCKADTKVCNFAEQCTAATKATCNDAARWDKMAKESSRLHGKTEANRTEYVLKSLEDKAALQSKIAKDFNNTCIAGRQGGQTSS